MRPLIACALLAGAAVLATPAGAVSPKYWIHDTASEFLGGEVDGASITGDGSVVLAPRVDRRTAPEVPYIWDVAAAADGNTAYLGTGDDGWVLRVRGETVEEFFQCAAFEVLSVAVGPDGAVYAGTAPEGFVYRIVDGQGEVLYDADEDYVWDLAFGPDGGLYAAVGPGGAVYRIDPSSGKTREVFRTDDNHVVSLAFAADGGLLLGTEGRGLVIRVAPDGGVRVLYDCPQGEVGAVMPGPDGTVWAAASSAAEAREEARRENSDSADGNGREEEEEDASDFIFTVTPPRSGNGVLYRIDAEGNASRHWASGETTIFDLAPGGDGTVLVATGEDGAIYRVDRDGRATLVLDAEEDQVVSIVPLPGDAGVLVGTANPSATYRLGRGPGAEGEYRSEVLDAQQLAHWGRIDWVGEDRGGRVTLSARAGNTDEPDDTWTDWADLGDGRSAELGLERSRFLQWRVRLSGGRDGGPVVRRVRVSSRENNVPPILLGVEVVPSGTRFFQEIPEVRPRPLYQALPGGVKVQYQFDQGGDLEHPAEARAPWAQGIRQVRWESLDPNGDILVFDLAYRREDETRWKDFAEEVEGTYYAFNGNGVPDGEYRIRVTATDRRSNPGDERTTVRESETFLVDNTSPGFDNLKHDRPDDARIRIRGEVVDALSDVVRLEYSLNGGDWTDRDPVDGIFDSPRERFDLTVDAPSGEEHTVLLRGTDNAGNLGATRILIRR